MTELTPQLYSARNTELDTALSIIEWIQRYNDRISATHLQDVAPIGECAYLKRFAENSFKTIKDRGW